MLKGIVHNAHFAACKRGSPSSRSVQSNQCRRTGPRPHYRKLELVLEELVLVFLLVLVLAARGEAPSVLVLVLVLVLAARGEVEQRGTDW
jgi:hypothetical protein